MPGEHPAEPVVSALLAPSLLRGSPRAGAQSGLSEAEVALRERGASQSPAMPLKHESGSAMTRLS